MAQKVLKKKIGEILIEAGKIHEDDLTKALELQKTSNKKIGEILVDLEIIKEEDLIIHLAIQFQVPFIKLENYQITEDVINIIPSALAIKYNCMPMDKIGNSVSFAICDPMNMYDLKQQESFLNCKMNFFVTTPLSLKSALSKYYGLK